MRDAEFGQRMQATFLDDLRHAKEIDLATFRRRSAFVRVAEWAASLITPFL